MVSADHSKVVHIDTGEAYISGLTELPLRINGFNIQYSEETSLDERYKFDKKITLSMKGYVNYKLFGGRYYAIIEDNDGIYYMVNVDFPSKITHTFNLSQSTNQTDFTFASLSNFPTIKLNSDFEAEDLPCMGYNVYGIESLKLIDKDYARLDTHNKKVITTDDWRTIEFLGNSCSLQEVFDGEKATDTITFQIPLNQKIGWAWNLLEFLDNLYASTITPKGGDNIYYSGFNFGLEPSYSIQTSSNNGESDIITITLVEMSNNGTTAAVDFSDEDYDTTHWRYVKWVDEIKCYECIGYARARYLVQQEVDAFGNPTGDYRVKDGYQSQYQMLNVVGTFNTDSQFNDAECAGDACQLNTDIPDLITFPEATCNTYSLSASCSWNITNLPSYITASPTSGLADTSYSVTICNTSSIISGQTDVFNIKCCNSVHYINTFLGEESFIHPTVININCLKQDVTFTFDADCPVTVTSNPSSLEYQLTNSNLIVTVPKNESETSGRTFTLTVKNCNNEIQELTINQDKVYTKWVTTGYMCVSGNSYNKEVKYTGTSTSNYSATQEYRQGSLITSGDTRCNNRITKWEFDDNYYCIDGNKYQCIEEFESYDDGSTWVKTWNTSLGNLVESASTFCENAATYKWELNQNKWQCGDDSPTPPAPTPSGYAAQYLTFVATEQGSFSFTNSVVNNSSIQYSLDSGSTWTTLSSGVQSPTLTTGQKIMWKGTMSDSGYTGTGIGTFSSTGRFTVEGNAMSLLYGNNFTGQTTQTSSFIYLFRGCTGLISAQNLILPATTLVNNAYNSMFYECTSLSSIPSQLPASSLTEGCYANMFDKTSITSIPSGYLSATTLADSCYWGMFNRCASLTSVPSDLLPASNLEEYCYGAMFSNCTSLTTAPVLSASTLVKGCYIQMFDYSSNLRYIKCLASSNSPTDCTRNWTRDVYPTGTFVKASGSTWNSGYYGWQGIPEGWTVQNDGESSQQERWVDSGTTCVGVDKYNLQVKQTSSDGGRTWTTTTDTRTGTLIATNSFDCGYAEQWVNSGTTCVGYDKYNIQVKQTSSDSGQTWTTTTQTRTGSLIEENSTDCGYGPTPPSPTGSGGTYWDTGLPVIVIDTPNGQAITSKEEWIEGASIKIYTDRNTIVYDNSALSIRGRGNSSWVYSDKKPYALKLESKAEILGMAKSKRWALLANYGDRILMRNRIANEIAQCTNLSSGMRWSPMGEFVELVLNGEHRGNYYLSEQIRVESNRLDIDEYSDCLYEIDRNDMDEDYTFRSVIKDYPYHIKSPDVPDVSLFKGKIDNVETLLNAGSGYASYLDYNSFADYWIVEELCQNFECRGHSPGSVYCYYVADSGVGKIKMGPPWDFDYSTFNLYWPLKAGDELCSGTTVPSNGYMPEVLAISCHIYYDWLFNDSSFKAVVKQRWNAIKSSLDAILNRFDYWYNTLYASEQLNWALWPIPSTFEPGHHPDYDMTFLEAKNSAKSFYSARLTYMNNLINSF